MGGEGSGRKPDIFNMITRQEDKVPIGNEIILPNYSGLREGAKKTDTEVMATRTYVDSQIAGENHWDMDLGQTVIYPHLGGINVSGSKCYWTDAYSTKLFVNTNTLTVSGSSVGIGTTNPQGKLEIGSSGNLRFFSSTDLTADVSMGYISANSRNTGVDELAKIDFRKGSTYYRGDIAFSTANDMAVGALTEKMRIRWDGNVGIGTTTPVGKLHVSGSLVLTDSTSPTLASNEGCLFLSGGACWFKGGSGTVTLIANA